jgi:hypothetical protein
MGVVGFPFVYHIIINDVNTMTNIHYTHLKKINAVLTYVQVKFFIENIQSESASCCSHS